jgi:hypothetical protein
MVPEASLSLVRCSHLPMQRAAFPESVLFLCYTNTLECPYGHKSRMILVVQTYGSPYSKQDSSVQ